MAGRKKNKAEDLGKTSNSVSAAGTTADTAAGTSAAASTGSGSVAGSAMGAAGSAAKHADLLLGLLKTGSGFISTMGAVVASAMIAYSGYVLYDSFSTQQRAYSSSWDLQQYKPQIVNDGEFAAVSNGDMLDAIPDYRGWLTIDETNIDYPVVQGPDDLYYASHDVHQNSSLTGAIYLAAGNSRDFTDSYNLIYGHHMDNGAMFGGLDQFKNESYYNSHRNGVIITGDESIYDLKVFAVMETDAYETRIYSVGNHAKAVMEFLTGDRSQDAGVGTEVLIYDESVAASAQKIVAMSTCDNAETNGRLVVLARMVRRTPEPTEEPSEEPVEEPTEPTDAPSEEPTDAPTEPSTEKPTEVSTDEPSEEPTEVPTEKPTEDNPTVKPTKYPTDEPTEELTERPTGALTDAPTEAPSDNPTDEPTEKTSENPTPTDDNTPNPTDTQSVTPEASATPSHMETESLSPSPTPTEIPVTTPVPTRTPATGPFRLEIRYEFLDGSEAAPPWIQMLMSGAPYSRVNPVLDGYTTARVQISGEMESRDIVIVVLYLPIEEASNTISIDEYDIPLGMDNLLAQMGVATE